jgi:hypothetical protein
MLHAIKCDVHLASLKADMVMRDEASTKKASHSLAPFMTLSALSFGTLSPKKTTFTRKTNQLFH